MPRLPSLASHSKGFQRQKAVLCLVYGLFLRRIPEESGEGTAAQGREITARQKHVFQHGVWTPVGFRVPSFHKRHPRSNKHASGPFSPRDSLKEKEPRTPTWVCLQVTLRASFHFWGFCSKSCIFLSGPDGPEVKRKQLGISCQAQAQIGWLMDTCEADALHVPNIVTFFLF